MGDTGEYSYDYESSNPSTRTEGITQDISQHTEKYRLWWQSLAAFDLIGLGAPEKSTKVIDSVTNQLSPQYDYNFDLGWFNSTSNVTLNELSYTKTIETVKTYRDGALDSTVRKQTNIKEEIPYCTLDNVSTMFFDYTFDYTLTETSNDMSSTGSSRSYSDYEVALDGSYVWDSTTYTFRRATANDLGLKYKKSKCI